MESKSYLELYERLINCEVNVAAIVALLAEKNIINVNEINETKEKIKCDTCYKTMFDEIEKAKKEIEKMESNDWNKILSDIFGF